MKKRNLTGRIFGIALASVLVGAMLVPLQVSGDTESEGNFQWTTNGPYGGYINSLAMATTNPDTIYAGTGGGRVFKTIDGGDTWTGTALSGSSVRIIQVAPDNPDIVYAGTSDGIYKTEDGGSSWTQKGLPGAIVNTIAIDSTNSDILYAGTGEPYEEVIGIFKSTDGGEAWEQKLSEDLDAVLALLIDSSNSSCVYAGVEDWDGLRKSTDGGETWESIHVTSDDWNPSEVVALAMTPAGFSPATVYAAVGASLYEDVYKSTDEGETWEATEIPADLFDPQAMVVDPNNPNVIYLSSHCVIGTGEYFFRSTDGGDTWSVKATGLPATPSTIVIDPRNSDTYVTLGSYSIYKSTDGAENWNPLSQQGMTSTYIEGLAIDPTSSDKVFAAIRGNGYHLAETTSGGASWDYLVSSPTHLGAVTIDPQNPSTIWVGEGMEYDYECYVYKSDDGGQNWTAIKFLEFIGGREYTAVRDILIHPNESDWLVVGNHHLVHEYGISGQGVVARTKDGGTSWESLKSWANALAADPNDPDVVYSGTRRANYVFQWTDVWEEATKTDITPAQGIGGVRDIEVDSDSKVYVAASDGLWRWDGSDWITLTGLPTDDITALAIDRSTNPQTLYVGTGGQGVLISQDGGSTWIPFNEGLGNLSITKLAISTSQPKMLYAGTEYGGVYSRMIGDLNNPPYQPVSPSPANHATNVPIDTDLSWSGGDPDAGDNVTYDVYFDTTDATTLVASDQPFTTYSPPGPLSYNTTYYWKVVAEDNHGAITSGPLWDFTTGGGGCEVDISVVLQGGSRPPEGWEVPITIKFFSPGADVMTDTPIGQCDCATTKSDSTAVCQCTVAPGTYDITAVSEHTLINVKRGVVISAPSTAVDMGTLLEGNANDDPIINISDFGILAVSYMKTEGQPGYDPRADFDRNGIINISDFGLLAVNYMKVSPIDISG